MRNGVRQVSAAGKRNALRLVVQRNAELGDFRTDEELQRRAAGYFSAVRKLRNVIVDFLGIAEIGIAGVPIQDADRVPLGQLIVIAEAANLIVARDVSRIRESQNTVRSGERDRRARAQIGGELG